ncbi:MAG: ERF family protein [Xanthobacteraceae bacterium]
MAKAQAELVNPEKSLVATIPSGCLGAAEERSFRYASLASGLDIVRKTLGQHEIAAVQTTSVDQAAGLVNLTTMLLHASGEWIASDWPVCPISELASPRRMGTALTYARRYALFTLVGIAGEDDLDAPDLQGRVVLPPPRAANGAGTGFAVAGGTDDLARKSHSTATGRRQGGRGRREHRSLPSILPAAPSAELRDQLFAEVATITTSEQAEAWAATALPIKNTLSVIDAEAIEQAFERKLIELAESVDVLAESAIAAERGKEAPHLAGNRTTELRDQALRSELGADSEPMASLRSAFEGKAADTSKGPPPGIDKSVLAISEPKRHRNKEHLRFVARQPCLVCGRKPSDAHHLRYIQPRALGLKPSDEFTVPLCRVHHRALHRVGDERAWWKTAGIKPAPFAQRLWQQTRGTETSQPELVGGGDKAAPSASAPVAAAMEAAAGAAIPGPCKASIDRAR